MRRRLGHSRAAIVDYDAVRSTYHAARAAAATAGALAALSISLVRMWPDGILVTSLAAGVAVQALFRLRRPDPSPTATLLLDATAVGGFMLLTGLAGAAPLLAYLITAAFLFLPLHKALATSAYVAGVGAGALVLLGDAGGLILGLLAFGALLATFVTTSGEVDEFRARQQAALETERKAGQMKNEFVSMVSHELRTPLTSIAGFGETLKESWQHLDPNEVEEFLSIITDQAEHLSELVEDILVIPRLEAGRLRLEPGSFELQPVAYRIADLLFPSGGPKEASVAIPGGVAVWADESRVRQVLRNLLENARKYGGDQVLVEGAPAGDRYLVVVSDNGPGVPEEDRERIFDPFEQLSKGDARAQPGIGLGLPIARKLIRAMGGEVWYEPRFPTGARFCFTLHVRPALAEAEEHPPTTLPPPGLRAASPEAPERRVAGG